MPQVLKETIREKILSSAALVFAQSGFHQSTMASIAKSAELSVGNLYRYYPSKEAILSALLPEQTVLAIRLMIVERLRWLSANASPDPYHGQDPSGLATKQAKDIVVWRPLLRLLLLDLSATPWENFFAHVRDDLLGAFLVWAEQGAYKLDADWSPRLVRLFTYLLKHLAEILASPLDETSLEKELSHVITYHVAGMYALLKMQNPGA